MAGQDHSSRRLQGRHILVIEDEQILVKRLQVALQDAGAEVTVKRCREEALTALRAQDRKYDLIVLDVKLPESAADVEAIDSLDKDLDEVRNTLRGEADLKDGEEESRAKLEKAYDQRSMLLAQRNALIQQRSGFELLEEWLKDFGEHWQEGIPPILFLTAVGEREAEEEGKRLVGSRSKYLVKPVSLSSLLSSAIELIHSEPPGSPRGGAVQEGQNGV
jgi:CheY-like chemotaxis protein